ncbi:hypothetical protein TevJSym_ae00390 [endosymbiont of Tevnia jerichonana (vent Tica)]|uniref:Uncharacterized protein n=1 Tax=endosymbiont of Tevnia jerichonana (vent Tica) TaxID=1049564 RepID=G2FD96_9GAMM|nr:hypothetical protein TevJSym_ae00390 [endosymbiont of Tevnia jerichonana (vent Tica)]
MSDRVSAAQRIRMQNLAEREVMRYAQDHAMWHKHVHNVDLDPIQVLKCLEMDRHPNTIDFSSRRTGKTAIKEMYELKKNATKSDQELGIVAPHEAQSLVNLGCHLDAIRRSPILEAWINFKSGRRQFADTYYEFTNRSKSRAYGIMAQVDGGDLTSASLEEVDDMPKDRLFSRFLLMMGAARRLGAASDSENEPEIRITGVFKGADTLTDLLSSGKYHALGCLHGEKATDQIRAYIAMGEMDEEAVDLESYSYPVPIANALTGAELGLLNKQFMANMKSQLSPDEYTRQLLCVNTASRNLIWETYVRRALQVGLMANLSILEPLPGVKHVKRGLLGFGYDAGGHGEDPKSSKHALVVVEQIGNYTTFPFCKTWSPGADDQVVKRDLIGFWDYFQPDTAFGDAYGVGMLTQLNDELYAEGLTHIDRRTVGDGDSTASTWPEWPFSPIRFEGMVKHNMASALRGAFHNNQAAIPYLDDQEESLLDPILADMRMLTRQLPNIVAVPTKTSYASYKQADSKIGDDLFDAAMAAVWGLATRGAVQVSTSILTRTRCRTELMKGAI